MNTSVVFVACIFLAGLVPLSAAKSVQARTLSLSDSSPAAVLESVEQLKSQSGKVRSGPARRDFVSDAEALSRKLRDLRSFDELSEKQRIALVNQYESLRARVAAAIDRGKRRICQRIRPTGSNLITTVCQTQDEIDKGTESVEAANALNSRRPFGGDGS